LETALDDCNRDKESQRVQMTNMRTKTDLQIEDLTSQLKDCMSQRENLRYQVDNLQRQISMSSITASTVSSQMSSPGSISIIKRTYTTDAKRGSPGTTSVTRTQTTKGSGVSSTTEKDIQDIFGSGGPKGESTGLEFDDDDDDEPEITTKRVVVKSSKAARD